MTNIFLCGAQEPESVLNPACFQIQILGESRGSVVEEWARAVCTEFVPTDPGVQLDVPGENGKLWAVQG